MRALGIVVASLLAVVPSGAAAQTAMINAVANVTQIGLSVGYNQELDFGVVVADVPTTVDPNTSTSAGQFEIHGARGAEIQITMTLPASLTLGASSMPIAFGPTAGCHRMMNQQNQCQYFDPSTPLLVRIWNRFPPDNTYYVWVGGTVSPTAAQPGGTYAGDITLTAAYTGN